MSGGEQQMCAVARGLMSKPSLLMIDELTLGLAPKVVDDIVARLPDIACVVRRSLRVHRGKSLSAATSASPVPNQPWHMAHRHLTPAPG